MASAVRFSVKFNHIFYNISRAAKLCKYNYAPFHSSRILGMKTQDSHNDTIYTEQHHSLRASVKQIIEKDINPYLDEWEAAGQFPAHQVLKKLAEGGFLGVQKPTEYGGLGLDYSYQLAFLEELGGINCGAIPMAVGVQTDMSTPALTRFGSEELKQQFLVPIIKGDQVSSIGVSEPGAGSDVASIRTKAEKDGDDYVINGSKMWITNGFQADWVCLLVNTSAGPVHANKSLICVPMDTPGIQLTRRIDKLGMRSSDTAEIFFENVRVPQKYRIGDEGMGFTYQMMQFQEERVCAVAVALLSLEKLIQSTAEYTGQRTIYGKPLLDNQVVHYRLAELQTELEALRALTYRTVDQLVAGNDVTKLASMCKLKGGRLCREITDSCLQYWGGMGFTNDVLVSRMYRDMRLLSIGGGADEVMLAIICKYMGTLPAPPKPSKK